jgi:glycine/D-amino acid oxidase-like deaminating enzyme
VTDRIVVRGDETHFYLDGKEVSEADYRKVYPPPRNDGPPLDDCPGAWPLLSDALAVHPTLTKEAMRDAAAKGVPTEFHEDGRPIFRDRDHRKRYMMATGYYDRGAGYSDAQPGYAKARGLQQRPREGPLSNRGF